MPEFLVLESSYRAVTSAGEWATGDRFRAVIDGSWYYGSIVENKWTATGEEWCCLDIMWDGTEDAEGSTDTFSPWELHKVSEGEQEPPLLTASPDYSEFPEAEQARVLALFKKTLELPMVECWREPVDFEVFKDYCKRVCLASECACVSASSSWSTSFSSSLIFLLSTDSIPDRPRDYRKALGERLLSEERGTDVGHQHDARQHRCV